MTDQLDLFRTETIRHTSRVLIQVGGGYLNSTKRGTALVSAKDGTSCYLENVLYVKNLGVNLISARKLSKEGGFKGTFNHEKIWVTDRKRVAMTATHSQGLYIVSNISDKYNGKILSTSSLTMKPGKNQSRALLVYEGNSTEENTDIDPDDSEPETATTKEQ
jgi:hypothetical protein